MLWNDLHLVFNNTTMSINLPMIGRTEIHNAVINLSHAEAPVFKFNQLIQKLIIQGCDVDQQDISGKTALHYAALLGKKVAIIVLLDYGTDINIFDNDGHTAFSYAIDCFCRDKTAAHSLAVSETVHHIRLLEDLEIYISKFNRNLLYQYSYLFPLNSVEFKSKRDYSMLKKCIKSTKYDFIGVRSLTLFDFLSETKLAKIYPYLKEEERYKLDTFYNSTQYEIYNGLTGVWKLQLRKAKFKCRLYEPAAESLTNLTGYVFPDVYEFIFQHLAVHDLRSLIASCKNYSFVNPIIIQYI